jgi:hypothetical protein
MLEQALRALADHDNSATADRTVRAQLVRTAGDALWCFMVQRESIGLRDPRPVLRDYRVPAEVQNRMGVSRTPPPGLVFDPIQNLAAKNCAIGPLSFP